MKVLYGINTNGQGHINRSRMFINELLKDGHEVHVLLSGKKPPEYAFHISPDTFYMLGPVDIHDGYKVDYYKTFQVNIANLGKLTKNRRDLLDLAITENYDVFFSDFEPTSSAVGRLVKKPVIGIDHQHSAFHPANDQAPAPVHLKLGLKYAIKIMMPYYSHCFTIDFASEITTHKNLTLLPLIWKPEFDNYNPTQKEHVLVYLARFDRVHFIPIFHMFPDIPFIVYGDKKEGQFGNVTFKRTDRSSFLEDLITSRAVITNGGFSLTWECCLLKKTLWIIPTINDYEQLTNAFRLKSLNRALVTETITEEFMHHFLYSPEMAQMTATKITILPLSTVMEQIYQHIDFHLKKNKKKEWWLMG